jgi:alanine racemase
VRALDERRTRDDFARLEEGILTQPVFEVDLGAVRHNAGRWRHFLGDRELWAVVKSDAYGCGAVDVARACVDAGAARLVIFDVEEARPIRAAGIRTPIVHVFPARGDALVAAVHLAVTPSVEDERGARELAAIGDWRARRIAAHVAVDTGTGWSGVQASRASEFARAVAPFSSILWEGAWTHIAGKESMDAQLRGFATAVAAMRAEGLAVPALHAASTGPLLWGRTTGAARVGVGLYGSSLGSAGLASELRTAVEVRARVIAVKRFDAPTPLGYGGQDIAQPGESIATLRIGYADGLPRSLADGGGVALAGGTLCPVAGAIGMNCTMLRVGSNAPIALGDEATFLGDRDGVRLDDVAAAAGMVPHALLMSLANGIGVRHAGGAA